MFTETRTEHSILCSEMFKQSADRTSPEGCHECALEDRAIAQQRTITDLLTALRAIADMANDGGTDYRTLSAIMIAIARVAIKDIGA